jgi:hypothetical protein
MIWAVLLALFAGQSEATPQTAPPAILDVDFAPLRPSEKVFAYLGPAGPYCPERLALMRVNGEAILNCRLGRAGHLYACKIVSASEPEFGLAARVMADRQRVTAPGSPSPRATITVRVPFVIGAPAAIGRSP